MKARLFGLGVGGLALGLGGLLLSACAGPRARAVPGDPVEALLRGQGCLACHDLHASGRGPAWSDLARQYGSDAGAEARMVRSVRDGVPAGWGPEPMPPHPNLSEADLQAMVRWVLARP